MTIRIGSGSAWWGDRISPAAANANLGKLQYLCFETMAEATISAAQVRKRKDPSFGGYDTWLDDRMNAVLPGCLANNTKIISNQGWINPIGADERVIYWLKKIGLHGVRVAAINGSLITDDVIQNTDIILESGLPTSTLSDSIVSGEVYLGAAPIVEALKDGADIVITGRV
ncbi:MAG: acyclic terpene utilization AtuA family protein, partial [Candidatus Poseidoniales archaeon]